MSDVVYWENLDYDEQLAVLTEAVRGGYLQEINGSRISDWVAERFRCDSPVYSRLGRLQIHPDGIAAIASVFDGFELALSSKDTAAYEGSSDFSRFWAFDPEEQPIKCYEPMMTAFVAGVPFDDLEWPISIDPDYDELWWSDTHRLLEKFADLVSAGLPCDLDTAKTTVCSLVDDDLLEVLCLDRCGMGFDISSDVDAFLRDIADHPYHCSFLGCDVTARS